MLDLTAPAEGSAAPDLSLVCDVSDKRALTAALSDVAARLGPVDIYVSNAGVLSVNTAETEIGDDADWARCWSVNVLAHVHAAHALLPGMARRGAGHFVTVASAAGLLNQIGDAPYSATKHAAVSFTESLAIAYGPRGVGVTLVCPQYVATPLLGLSARSPEGDGVLLSAEDVAVCVIDAVAAGKFLVLPHPEVLDYARQRADDHDRWIRGMTKLRARALDRFGDALPERFYRLL